MSVLKVVRCWQKLANTLAKRLILHKTFSSVLRGKFPYNLSASSEQSKSVTRSRVSKATLFRFRGEFMETGAVYKAIRRSNFNQLLVSTLALAGILGVGALSVIPFFLAMVTQPHELDLEDLLQASPEQPQYWVTIRGDYIIDTQYSYTEDEFLEGGQPHYGALAIDDTYLFVEQIGTIKERDDVFTGHLMAMESQVENDIVSLWVGARRDVSRGDVLPVMLVTYHRQWYAGGVVWLLLFLGFSYLFLRAILRYLSPSRHPMLSDLNTFGDPEKVIDEVYDDLKVYGETDGALQFGRRWMLYNPKSDFRPFPYKDLMWAHKYSVTNKRYGITVSKTHHINLYTRDGKMRQFQAKEPQVDGWLRKIGEKSNGTVIGWSDQILAMWNKQRDEFIHTVDERAKG